MAAKNFAFLETSDAESPMVHFTSARGMPAKLAAQLRQYENGSAYCLMLYACSSCLHREVLWNSRDGITAFSIVCPTCGKTTLSHSQFAHDWCVPEHVPHEGQRVWIDMTKERATELAQIQIKQRESLGAHVLPGIRRKLILSHYLEGAGPDLVICGYGWRPKK